MFLETPDRDRSYPAVFSPETGQPWHKLGVLPVGHHVNAYSILLPTRVGPDKPVLVHQVVHYGEWLGLWTVLVPLPDVADAAEAKLPD